MSDTVLITLIVGIVVVVLLTLWLGRRLVMKGDENGSMIIEVGEEQDIGTGSKIKAAEGADISKANVGDISGVKITGKNEMNATNIIHGASLEVGKDASISDAQVGDISGIKLSNPDKSES